MVFMCNGGTKKGHHTISSELIDSTFIFVNLIHQNPETSIHDLMDLLRIELLRHGGVIGHIRKKHGHNLPLALNGTASSKDLVGQKLGGVGLWF